jgi:ArsR family metal-binding transcriptional regulator
VEMTVAKHRDIPLFESYYRPDRFKVYKGLPNLKCIFCGECSPIPFDMDIHLFLDHKDEYIDGIDSLVESMELEAIENRRYFGCEDEGG